MPHKRVAPAIMRSLSRLLPRWLHTPSVRAHVRIDGLTRAQRERLRQNLQAMLRPETA